MCNCFKVKVHNWAHAPWADVLITVGWQEEEQMRSGAKLLEEGLKARTVALGYLWVHNLVHGGTTTIWMTM